MTDTQRPRNTWKDRNYAVNEAKRIMKQEGWTRLPSSEALREKGYSAFVSAIQMHHGGIHSFRDSLGQTQTSRKHGLWKDLEYALDQAKAMMKKEDWTSFPSEYVMRQKGYGSLGCAIDKYHGGIVKFREHFGETSLVTPAGLWETLDYTLKQAKEIMQNENWTTLPSSNGLKDKGYSGLNYAIIKFHGGFPEFRKLLGETAIKRKLGIWKDLEFSLKHAQEMLQKESWDMLPKMRIMQQKGYSALVGAITNYHGGLPVFQQKLDKYMGIEREIVPNRLDVDFSKVDPVKYFEEKYKGKLSTRKELQDEHYKLYGALYKSGKLDEIFPRQIRSRKRFESVDPVAYFKEHFEGKIIYRRDLMKADSQLYNHLLKTGKINEVLPQKPRRDLSTLDPVAYFKEHYAGMFKTKEQLRQKDQPLYCLLRDQGKFDLVFPRKNDGLDDILRDYAEGGE
jgi:hypothetical protein